MKGIQVSLTGNERDKLLDAVACYISTMSEGVETYKLIEEELNNGLGSAMHKLYKGLNGEQSYEHYKKK